jgi:hypothetical protein
MEKINWAQLGGRRTSYHLHRDVLRGLYLRAITTRPVPHSLTKPAGLYAVEFDRQFALTKVRETLIAPLRDCPLSEILELVVTAYVLECPESPVVGDDLGKLINHHA